MIPRNGRQRELDHALAALDDRQAARRVAVALLDRREDAHVLRRRAAARPASAPRPCRFEITPYGTRGRGLQDGDRAAGRRARRPRRGSGRSRRAARRRRGRASGSRRSRSRPSSTSPRRDAVAREVRRAGPALVVEEALVADRVDRDRRCPAAMRRTGASVSHGQPAPQHRGGRRAAGRRRPGSRPCRAATLHSSVPHPHDDAVMKTWDDARRHLVLMLALTFTTGIVDAVGYLGPGPGVHREHDRERGHPRHGARGCRRPAGARPGARAGRLPGRCRARRTRAAHRARPAGRDRTSVTFAATGVLAVGLGVGALVAPPERGPRSGRSSSPRCWPSRWGCRPRPRAGWPSRT